MPWWHLIWFVIGLELQRKCAFKAPNSIKHIPKWIVYFSCQLDAFPFVSYIWWWEKIIIYCVWISVTALTVDLVINFWISIHVYAALLHHTCLLCCVWLPSIGNVCVALLYLSLYGINLYVSYFKCYSVCIPQQCLAISGNYKNTHLFLMSLNLIFTVHIPNCGMIVLLYVLNFIFPFIAFLSSSSVIFLNGFLNMCHSIILPSLPASILCGITILLGSVCISNSAINNDQFFFKWAESILTVSISPSLSWDISTYISFTTLSFLLWHTFLKCPVLPQPEHVFPHAGHCLSTCTPPQYWYDCHCDVQITGALALSSFGLFAIFTLLNCLDSVRVSNTVACTLCASTHFAHASTPPLVIWSSLLVAVSSVMISSNMCLSLRLWMNCSLSYLSISW